MGNLLLHLLCRISMLHHKNWLTLLNKNGKPSELLANLEKFIRISFDRSKIINAKLIIANDTATTSTNATPGNNFSCLNQTIIDIENILYKNCIELSQHETKLITLLERSEAMEKN
ncbi:unnamed protein product, partial [Schistosoma margrebowiei]